MPNVDNNLNCVQVINKPCMSSRHMSLLPRAALHSDSEQLVYGENCPPSLWQAWLAYLIRVLSKDSSVPKISVTWTCDKLDWFSLIIIFIDSNSPFIIPHEKE